MNDGETLWAQRINDIRIEIDIINLWRREIFNYIVG